MFKGLSGVGRRNLQKGGGSQGVEHWSLKSELHLSTWRATNALTPWWHLKLPHMLGTRETLLRT